MASTSQLIVIIGVIALSIRWYRHRCVWAWFQIQLGVALVPPSSVYLFETKSTVSLITVKFESRSCISFSNTTQIFNPFWTILLTVATYQFVTTVWAMIMYLKMNAIKRQDEMVATDKLNQNNIRLIGLSIGNLLHKYSWHSRDNHCDSLHVILSKGIPLSLSGVQSLIEEFSTDSPFVSWLFQLSSISGIFFCLVYCTLLIAILSLYVISTRETNISSEKFNAFTQEVSNVTGIRYNYILNLTHSLSLCNQLNSFDFSTRYNQCCLILTILSLLFTGTMLSHLHWMSLSVHCIAAFLHLLEVWTTFFSLRFCS